MPTITTRENLNTSPALGDFVPRDPASSSASFTEGTLSSTSDASQSSVTRVVTLAKCLRCGFEWLPRKASPAQCAHCRSSLWNVPRAQQLPGKPAPTRKGKPRGRAFVVGDPRQSVNKKKHESA